jgi:LAO/AO transport system kinase
MSIDELVRDAREAGPSGVRAAARLMSILADAPHRLPEVYHAAARLPGGADQGPQLPRFLLGLTGAPGSGKSTLTDALVREWRRRHPERRVGVVAVDPSSPFTGGAVLGDRVRMMRHATDPMVYVRSMASRGHLGGLALGVKGVVRVMGLVGCDVVFIETVGVGQSEVEIASVADLVMVVLAPGLGDSVQLLKAGLMEIGDLFVVNKADRPEATRLHAELASMLRAAAAADGAAPRRAALAVPGEPRSYLVSAEENRGVDALVTGLEALGARHGEAWQEHRRRMIEEEVREAIMEEAGRRLRDTLAREPGTPVSDVLDGRLSVQDAASRVLRETCRRSPSAQ